MVYMDQYAFTFQYGYSKTKMFDNTWLEKVNLHSNMVIVKLKTSFSNAPFSNIYIPIWL